MEDLHTKIEIEALIAEREGMSAENKQREHLGQSLAYDEGAFQDLAEKMRSLLQYIEIAEDRLRNEMTKAIAESLE